MARMKKEEVIERLRSLGLEIGENENYNSLCKKLKEATKKEAPVLGVGVSQALYDRASKKIGMTDEMIAS